MAVRDLGRDCSSVDAQELHVLAVDDSVVDRKVIERLLKISCCKVTAVESGRRALQYLGLDGDRSSVEFDTDGISEEEQFISCCESSGLTLGNEVTCLLGRFKSLKQVKHEFQREKMAGLKVNLIMTDYSMPGMTGYELLKRIKGSSKLREIPVVVMSSENILTRIDRCLEEGAEEFLVKPVKLSDVKRLTDFILRGDGNSQRKGSRKRKTRDDSSSATSSPSALCRDFHLPANSISPRTLSAD